MASSSFHGKTFTVRAPSGLGGGGRKALLDIGNRLPSLESAAKASVTHIKKSEEPRSKLIRRSALKRFCPLPSLPPSPPKRATPPDNIPPLPCGVKDIDANESDPQFCPDLVVPIYLYLRRLELSFAIPKMYLKCSCITPKMRSVLIDWLSEVHSRFNLVTETLHLTVSLLDRFLSCPTANIKRKQLQLVGVTAMLIASKIEDIYCPEIADFVYITDKSCSSQEIRDMELNILKTLNFRLNSPLSIHFLRRASKAGGVSQKQHTLAKYILELALLNYEVISEPPSLQGAASLWLASRIIISSVSPVKPLWSPTQAYYSGYEASQLLPLSKKFTAILSGAESSKFRATYQKYSLSGNLRISHSPELRHLPSLSSSS